MFFVDWFEEHENIRLRSTGTGGEHEKQVADTLRWWRFGHANRKRGSLESCTENDDSWRGKC